MTRTSPNAALDPARNSLSAIRTDIAALKAERARVFAAPLPEAEALAALDRVMAAQVAVWREDALNLPALTKHTSDPADFRLIRRYGLGEDRSDRAASGLLWLAFGPAIRKTIEAELKAWYAAAGKPMTARDRAAALDRLNGQIAELEGKERELLDALAEIA